jgi:hypothetical protein
MRHADNNLPAVQDSPIGRRSVPAAVPRFAARAYQSDRMRSAAAAALRATPQLLQQPIERSIARRCSRDHCVDFTSRVLLSVLRAHLHFTYIGPPAPGRRA